MPYTHFSKYIPKQNYLIKFLPAINDFALLIMSPMKFHKLKVGLFGIQTPFTQVEPVKHKTAAHESGFLVCAFVNAESLFYK